MEGEVFLEILKDLQREGMTAETTHGNRRYRLDGFEPERGLYTIPLADEPTVVVLSPRRRSGAAVSRSSRSARAR